MARHRHTLAHPSYPLLTIIRWLWLLAAAGCVLGAMALIPQVGESEVIGGVVLPPQVTWFEVVVVFGVATALVVLAELVRLAQVTSERVHDIADAKHAERNAAAMAETAN